MDKAYEPQKHEDALSQKWAEAKVFQAPRKADSRTGNSFVVPIPPPNVTGQLHLGHAMMLVVEDIMCRYHRMKGDATLWIPGTDHASIATETVVLKKLGIQNRDEEISREKFLEECIKWTEQCHDTITGQVKKMGSSCDWTRERYTIDLGMSNAVNTIFHDLFKAGLIYRGERMINWSVGAQSVLADDELEWEERNEPFYYIQCGEFVIGTVRPETKCWHSPVVVHPEDKRYKHLIGTEFEYETYAGKRIFRVIADEHVDPELGTGAMTISTAHDEHDFEIAQRHDLDFPQKIDFHGRMTDLAGSCAGMTVAEARKKSVEIMKEKGLIVKEDTDYVHRVPLCYRTGTVVEPMISKQWFIDVNKEFDHPLLKKKTTLKKLTAGAVRDGDVKIVPERFNKTYFQWVDNLRDWCISRQIWWGHRIPAWYDKEGNVHLAEKQNLIFARHGESEGNAAGLICGRHNSTLTKKGEEQAKQLAKKLKKERKVQKIITSSLSRSQKTAEIIAIEIGCKIETWEDCAEIDAGDLTQKEKGDRNTLFERITSAQNAETADQLFARVKAFWDKVNTLESEEGDILFIGHGMFTAAIFAVRDGVTPEHFQEYWNRWQFGNGEIREMTWMLPPQGENLQQDEDTLDTWFSSALWPFSTLGWPDEQDPDFQDFFPTSILETGHDILFFWVARMIMFSTFATGKMPFHTVYLHGLVCDEHGKKMSKSKGNGIDPLEMIEKFGTDALRMSMVVGTTPGNQSNLGEKKIEGYRNFANKLWNVARFILSQNTENKGLQPLVLKPNTLTEKWILSKTQQLIADVTDGIETHRYGEVGAKLYEFTWNELADWAIEASKADASENTPAILQSVLQILLKLLHPYTPFVTEKIWSEMNPPALLAVTSWPEIDMKLQDEEAEADFELLKNIITNIRSLRHESNIKPEKEVHVFFYITNRNQESLIKKSEKMIKKLARLKSFSVGLDDPKEDLIKMCFSAILKGGIKIYIPLEGAVDPYREDEIEKIEKELEKTIEEKNLYESRLNNKNYTAKAPDHLVQETKENLKKSVQKIEQLKVQKEMLEKQKESLKSQYKK